LSRTIPDFWDWAVKAYGGEGVAELCLDLQDADGQNVSLLLWALWCTSEGIVVDAALAKQAADMARVWSDAVILPLRQVRRRLKSPLSGDDTAARLPLRDSVKTVELQAEKALMAQLSGLCRLRERQFLPPGVQTVLRLNALLAAASAWGTDYPAEKLARLTQALTNA